MTSYVYFVRAGSDGPVKIGHTVDVEKRISGLQTGCPQKLELLGVIECEHARSREAELHERFASLRIERSEWFRWSPGIADVISAETKPYQSQDRIDISDSARSLGLSVMQIDKGTVAKLRSDASKKNGIPPWDMLYLSLISEHGAKGLHNRVRVGDLTMETLLDIERARLRNTFRARIGRTPSAQELRQELSWSNINGGPMTTEPTTGRHLIGDGFFVLPIDSQLYRP